MSAGYEFDGDYYDDTRAGQDSLLQAIAEAVTTEINTRHAELSEQDKDDMVETMWQNTHYQAPFWQNVQAIMQDAPCEIEVTQKTPVDVAFRVDRAGEFKGDVTGVFSGMESAPGWLQCYGSIGQHASCERGWYRNTRPATADEYGDMLEELESIGYDVTPVKRARWTARA